MIDVLNLRVPADLDDRYRLSSLIPTAERPAVFIGPYEHHSNELPWRESIADLVVIHEDQRRPHRPGVAGEGADPVSGSATEDRKLFGRVECDRDHQRLAIHLRAAAPPRRTLILGFRHGRAVHRDPDGVSGPRAGPALPGRGLHLAAQVHRRSGHAGVLGGRRELFRNKVPGMPGGGTVAYVNPPEHDYLADVEHREEGGTPGHRRVDPRRPRLPAQGGCRRRRDPPPGGILHPASDRAGAPRPQPRDPRQP